ncbi:unnamed protein product [Absidia cylindrospora]
MTKDDPVERRPQESTNNDTQQEQQKPFQIVLVDIEKGAQLDLHCVEKPLEVSAKELSFVALSYRWGELLETTIDTQLDYLATITSFNLYDLYKLCFMMTYEPDLKHIKYVWVDAICVDQTNNERRKATIHQMSNIYEKATYILAVPDLHMRHLMAISRENDNIMENSFEFSKYIFYLIQKNTDQLQLLDDAFLDKIKVPKDRTLRQLLAKCTPYLADGFTTFQQQHVHDIEQPEDVLDLLCEIYQSALLPATPHENFDLTKHQTPNDDPLLHYDNVASIILDEPDRRWMKLGKRDKRWAHALMKRGNAIRQCMQFLSDLIVDWSSRVWVISEYHIAKKKNNLKYWFLQLSSREAVELPFFTFDFTNPAFFSVIQNTHFVSTKNKRNPNPNPVHLLFHRLIIKQLNTQTFFEMMLKSKATKNEDRFYAILPQSKYKDKVNQVDQWNIKTLMSVKLKLFEIMDTKDRWILLFLCGSRCSSVMDGVLPSFCASDIGWNEISTFVEDYPYNFDMHNESSSTAIRVQRTKDARLPYLQLTPKGYDVNKNPCLEDNLVYVSRLKNALYNRLQVDLKTVLDIVCLPQYDQKAIPSGSIREKYMRLNSIALVGSFVENKWILCRLKLGYEPSKYNCHDNGDDHHTVFNIY